MGRHNETLKTRLFLNNGTLFFPCWGHTSQSGLWTSESGVRTPVSKEITHFILKYYTTICWPLPFRFHNSWIFRAEKSSVLELESDSKPAKRTSTQSAFKKLWSKTTGPVGKRRRSSMQTESWQVSNPSLQEEYGNYMLGTCQTGRRILVKMKRMKSSQGHWK